MLEIDLELVGTAKKIINSTASFYKSLVEIPECIFQLRIVVLFLPKQKLKQVASARFKKLCNPFGGSSMVKFVSKILPLKVNRLPLCIPNHNFPFLSG